MKNLSQNLLSSIGWIGFVGLIIAFGFLFGMESYKLSTLILHITTCLVIILYIFYAIIRCAGKNTVDNDYDTIQSIGMCFAIIIPFILLALEICTIQLSSL